LLNWRFRDRQSVLGYRHGHNHWRFVFTAPFRLVPVLERGKAPTLTHDVVVNEKNT